MERVKVIFGIIYSYPFYAFGWLIGKIVKLFILAKAAFEEGSDAGINL